MRLLLATSNAGKLVEVQRLLSAQGLEVIGLEEISGADQEAGRDSVEEKGSTYAENALIKARYYNRRTGLVTVADDSGLEVFALNGGPGLLSARYGASDVERIGRLLRALSGVSGPGRAARFVCAAAIAWNEGEKGERVFFGEARGEILMEAKGRGGFGYDPIFYYRPLEKTFAEMSPQEKDVVSHRGAAFKELAGWLIGSGIA